jgi:subtilisin
MKVFFGQSRVLRLMTVMGAMLFACTGVVLAQTSDDLRAANKPAAPATLAAQESRVVPDHYIVVLNGDATRAAERSAAAEDPARAAEQAAARVAGNLARGKGIEVTQTYGNALKGFAAKIPPGRLDALRNDPRVDFVSPDREVRGSAQSLPFGINRADADLSSTRAGNGSGSVNADVAILDSGIRKVSTSTGWRSHADLNVKGGYNCLTTNRGNWGDAHGHGTHVAGSAAAKDNTIGVVGTAPGARLWAIRVLNSQGSGTWSQIICGVNRVTAMNKDSATTNNIEVANMSLGGKVTTNGTADDGNCGNANNDALHRAICNSVAAKITYVVAAMNDGENTANYIPASYGEVMTVSALADYNGRPGGGAPNTCQDDSQPDDDFAFFSNFGADVDIGAPGVCIRSTSHSGGYEIMSGTSMASPHVAGAAALYKATHPAASPATVRSFMINPANSEALGQGHTDSFGLNPEPVLQMDNY